mgnify:CR=1 FL=1
MWRVELSRAATTGYGALGHQHTQVGKRCDAAHGRVIAEFPLTPQVAEVGDVRQGRDALPGEVS